MGIKPSPLFFFHRDTLGISDLPAKSVRSLGTQVVRNGAWFASVLCTEVCQSGSETLFRAELLSVNQEHLLLATKSHEP